MAIAASPLTPIGTARLAEPASGVAVDVPVLVTGAASIVVLLVACSAWPAWRLASARAAGLREQAAAGPPARTTARLVSSWAPVTAATGVRLALSPGRGRTSVSARGALAGLPLGVAAGRWGWALSATGLGIPPDPVPPVAVLLMVPAVVLAGNAVVFWPGRASARLSPARVLRAE
jgi:hypothetical protein